MHVGPIWAGPQQATYGLGLGCPCPHCPLKNRHGAHMGCPMWGPYGLAHSKPHMGWVWAACAHTAHSRTHMGLMLLYLLGHIWGHTSLACLNQRKLFSSTPRPPVLRGGLVLPSSGEYSTQQLMLHSQNGRDVDQTLLWELPD